MVHNSHHRSGIGRLGSGDMEMSMTIQGATSRKYNTRVGSDKTIIVSVRNVYGRETIYPACPTSVFFAALAKTTTLTEDTMRLILEQGYQVVAEAPTIRFAS